MVHHGASWCIMVHNGAPMVHRKDGTLDRPGSVYQQKDWDPNFLFAVQIVPDFNSHDWEPLIRMSSSQDHGLTNRRIQKASGNMVLAKQKRLHQVQHVDSYLNIYVYICDINVHIYSYVYMYLQCKCIHVFPLYV